jgi:DNA-binding response OmpR family regulator
MVKKTSILVVDDDPRLLRFVRANLESVGFKVSVADEVHSALELVERETPDLIILDIMLPEVDGYEFCQRVREFSTVPIIMLTAKVEESDKVKGLRLGADDYLTKPFGIQELLARVEALLRRSRFSEGVKTPTVFTRGDVTIDFTRRRVMVRGQEVAFTPTEYRLLCELATNAGKVMLHEELLTRVWGAEYRNELEYLRAYIRHLRRKIERDPRQPQHIISKTGIGYMFVEPS